jgi:hypothetical protein
MRGTVQNLKRSFSFGRARRLKFPSKQTKIKRRAAGRHRSPGDLRKRGQHAPPLPGLPPAHPHPIPRVSHAAPSIGRAHASILACLPTTPSPSPRLHAASPLPQHHAHAGLHALDRLLYFPPRARASRCCQNPIIHFHARPAGRPACLPVEKLQLAQYRYHIQVQPCSSLQLGSETYVDR